MPELAILLLLLLVVFVLILPIVAMISASRANRTSRDLEWKVRELSVEVSELKAARRKGKSRELVEKLAVEEKSGEAPLEELLEEAKAGVGAVGDGDSEVAGVADPDPVEPPPLPAEVFGESGTGGINGEALTESPDDGGAPAEGQHTAGGTPVPPSVQPSSAKPAFDWEQFMGAKLFAWIGGLALFLGIGFFVKYAFDRDLIPPSMRVAAGFASGIGLLAGGYFLNRKRYAITSHTLCATGILVLYATTFACRAVYHFPAFGLIPTFLLMSLITVVAFLIAARFHALVVAVLGLVGGFLTPVLLSTGNDHAIGLFSYILLLNLGLMALALHKNGRWDFLLGLSALGTIAMQWGWYERFFELAKTPITLGIFLLFVVLYTLGAFWANRRDRLGNWWLWTTVAMAGSAFIYGLTTVASLQLARDPQWVLAAVFVPSFCLAALSILGKRSPLFHALGAVAGFVVLGAWMARIGDDPAMLPWILGACLAFALLHTAIPLLKARLGISGPGHRWVHLIPLLSLAAGDDPGDRPGSAQHDDLAGGVRDRGPAGGDGGHGARSLASGGGVATHPDPAGILDLHGAERHRFRHVAGGGDRGVRAGNFRGDLHVAWQVPVGFRRVRSAPGALGSTLPCSHPAPSGGFGGPAFRPPQPGGRPHADARSLAGFRVGGAPCRALVGTGLDPAEPHPAAGRIDLRRGPPIRLERKPSGPGHRCRHRHHPAALAHRVLRRLHDFPFLAARRMTGSVLPWIASALAGPVHFLLVHILVGDAFPNDYMGLIPALFAVPALLGLVWLAKKLPADAENRNTLLAWFGGVALLFITLIFPIQFSREWITISWALEGAALIWLFHRIPHPGLRLTGLGLLAISFLRLALNPAVLSYHVRGDTPILNWYLWAYGIGAGCFFAAAWLLKSPRDRVLGFRVPPVLAGLGTFLLFLLVNIEIADFFTKPGTRVLAFDFSGNFARDMCYTIAWSLFALALLVIGLVRRLSIARYAGLALLAIALLKLFLHDLANLEALYRIGALIGTAVIAIVASFLYQKLLSVSEPEPSPPEGLDEAPDPNSTDEES